MSRCHVWLALSLYAALTSSAQLSPPPPDIVHIPLVRSGGTDIKYVAQVNMSYGVQTQRFGFALSTSTGFTIVANPACASCESNNIPTYNVSQSSSAKPIGSGQQQQAVAFAGGTVQAGSGSLSKEDCALHQANGSFWLYPNQTIVQANASAVFQEGISGLIGLGTDLAGFADTVLGGWLARNPAQNNVSFGLALNPPPPPAQNQIPAGGDPEDAGASGGTLHMLQPDPESYVGEIQWIPVVQGTIPAAGAGGADPSDASWLVRTDGWEFTSGTAKTSNSQAFLTSIDPYFANIIMPNAQAAQLYSALAGSRAIPPTPGDFGQQYSIPCDADISFAVTLAGLQYSVPKEALVVQNTGGTCTGAIEGWVDDTVPLYLLGSRFISLVYMVFQVSRPPSMQQQVGIAQRVHNSSPKHKSHVGAIVGGVIGGVAGVLIVLGALFWRIKRQQRTRPRSAAAAGTGEMEKMHGPRSPTSTAVPWTPTSGTHRDRTPTSATFSNTSPVSAAAYETSFFPHPVSPPGTATSDGFPVPKVSQWVSDLRPTSESYSRPAAHRVSAEYDYGNGGEPGKGVS